MHTPSDHLTNDHVDDELRALVAEMVSLAPAADTLGENTTVDVSKHTPQRSFVLTGAAAAVLFAAVLGGWWISRQPTTEIETTQPGATDAAAAAAPVEQPYRWTVTTNMGGAPNVGVVDPVSGFADFTTSELGFSVRSDGSVVGVRFDGAGVIAGATPDEWYLAGPQFFDSPGEFSVFFAERTKTVEGIAETFTVGEWAQLGRELVNDEETSHIRATASADFGEEVFITDSIIGFLELFGPWEGTIDAWIRDDGLVSRVVLTVNNDNSPTETVQIDYLDYGEQASIEWPDGEPPIEALPG